MHHMNLMMGHWCSIIQWLNLKVCADVINSQLKAIKAVLRLSRRHVQALMFKVGFIFNHLRLQNQSLRKLQVIWDTSVPP